MTVVASGTPQSWRHDHPIQEHPSRVNDRRGVRNTPTRDVRNTPVMTSWPPHLGPPQPCGWPSWRQELLFVVQSVFWRHRRLTLPVLLLYDLPHSHTGVISLMMMTTITNLILFILFKIFAHSQVTSDSKHTEMTYEPESKAPGSNDH